MTFLRSVRTRLALWHTAWLATILLTFGVSAYFYTQSVLSENLDRSLRTEVKWVNEFIEPRARKVRLKRSAVKELQQLRKQAAGQETQAEQEEAEIDRIWNQIYQHTLLSPRRHFIQILDRNNDLLYRSPSLGEQRIEFNDFPYNTVNTITIRDESGRELRLAVTQNDFVKIIVAYPLEDLQDVLGNLFITFLPPPRRSLSARPRRFSRGRLVPGSQILKTSGCDHENGPRDLPSKPQPTASAPACGRRAGTIDVNLQRHDPASAVLLRTGAEIFRRCFP